MGILLIYGYVHQVQEVEGKSNSPSQDLVRAATGSVCISMHILLQPLGLFQVGRTLVASFSLQKILTPINVCPQEPGKTVGIWFDLTKSKPASLEGWRPVQYALRLLKLLPEESSLPNHSSSALPRTSSLPAHGSLPPSPIVEETFDSCLEATIPGSLGSDGTLIALYIEDDQVRVAGRWSRADAMLREYAGNCCLLFGIHSTDVRRLPDVTYLWGENVSVCC